MHLFIWNQFSSNHSGSLTIVGAFDTVENAAEAETKLRQIILEIHQWFDRPENGQYGNLILGAPPTPIEAALFRRYNLPLQETMQLNGADVRESLSITTTGNLVQLHIGETWGLEEKYPLKDLLLKLGAEQAAIDQEVSGEMIMQTQYHLTCMMSDEGNYLEQTDAFLNERMIDEDTGDVLDDLFKVTAEDQQMSIHLRLSIPNNGDLRSLYDFLHSCGCTDIQWQVEEYLAVDEAIAQASGDGSEDITLVSQLAIVPEKEEIPTDDVPKIEWCEVPAGEFIMGGDPAAWNGLGVGVPEVRAELPYTFWITKHPITYAQYAEFVTTGNYHQRRFWTEAGWHYKKPETWNNLGSYTANHPVTGIMWHEVFAYAQWLNEQNIDKLALAPKDFIIRLPRECEWEKAARHPDGRLFPWGNEWDATRLYWRWGHTSAVGSTPSGANPAHGANDLLGNVWEWCLTNWAEKYLSPDFENNAAEDHASSIEMLRCVRGGGKGSDSTAFLRSSARYAENPRSKHSNLGFRVVLSISL